ncbi:MAG: hypothetical protein ACRDPQ_07455 [Nocardioidaceae bacterium]|jgi:hypothetical protein
MAWTWQLESATGKPVRVDDAHEASFPTRADAESWIGESWRELRDAGVDQVRLFEGDREVYGPMSLHDA